MILQEFKPGQKVISNKGSKPLNDIVYTVITADPVYQKLPLIKRMGFIFGSQEPQKIIVNYIYRCKSAVDMKDFPQEELVAHTPINPDKINLVSPSEKITIRSN